MRYKVTGVTDAGRRVLEFDGRGCPALCLVAWVRVGGPIRCGWPPLGRLGFCAHHPATWLRRLFGLPTRYEIN